MGILVTVIMGVIDVEVVCCSAVDVDELELDADTNVSELVTVV